MVKANQGKMDQGIKAALFLCFKELIFTDDEEEEEMVSSALIDSNSDYREPPVKKPKIEDYYEVVIPRYLTDDFKSHFRLERSTVEYVIIQLGNQNILQPGRLPLPLEKQFLILLWYLGNQEVFRSIADRFNVAKSTAFECINRVMDLVIPFRNQYIQWPNEREAKKTADYIQATYNFPDVIGCIDGSHIAISKPKEQPDTYINRHNYHSLILQGICNAKREFIDVSCGWSGRMHDARVLRRSDFGETLTENPNELFYGRYHLLSDSAYPISNYKLSPFRDNGHLTRRQKKFNRLLSSIRIVIEHTFGLLKTRFMILKFVNKYRTEDIPKLILLCCILHNICQTQNDEIENEEDFADEPNEYLQQEINENVAAGVAKRDYIASIL